jgi:uncharacterized coiled-coil DUF342 family protein
MGWSFQADTDKMLRIAEIYGGQAENLTRVITTLSAQVQSLADLQDEEVLSIIHEIETTVLPQLQKLHQFVDDSHQKTTHFVEQLQVLKPAMDQLVEQMPKLKAITQQVHDNVQRTLARQQVEEGGTDDIP